MTTLIVVAACTEDATGQPDTISGEGTAGTTPNETTPGPTPGNGACEVPQGRPFTSGDSTELDHLGSVDGVEVSGALYPHPDYEGNPWSQWGQGMVIDDSRYYSAIGDHLGVDGNSYIYEYDPATDTLALVGDILSHVDHVPGTWGYGKIHSQMVPGPCGEIYFSTYWGTFRDIEFDGSYTGDLLFRLDPFDRAMSALGVPVEHHGQASLAGDPATGLVYGEAVDPLLKNEDIDRGPFFAYDVVAEEVVYEGPSQPHVGYRSILVDGAGKAFYSIGGGHMQVYDPDTGESDTHGAELPGEFLRAVSPPAPDGSIYGVTQNPEVFFVMSPDGSIKGLGEARGYTASVALSPDASVFYYMPGAHGSAHESGAPVIGVDTATGEQTVVVQLNEIVEQSLGYTVGGTYNIAVSPDGSRLFLGVNVGETGSDETFGEVVLLVLDLP